MTAVPAACPVYISSPSDLNPPATSSLFPPGRCILLLQWRDCPVCARLSSSACPWSRPTLKNTCRSATAHAVPAITVSGSGLYKYSQCHRHTWTRPHCIWPDSHPRQPCSRAQPASRIPPAYGSSRQYIHSRQPVSDCHPVFASCHQDRC